MLGREYGADDPYDQPTAHTRRPEPGRDIAPVGREFRERLGDRHQHEQRVDREQRKRLEQKRVGVIGVAPQSTGEKRPGQHREHRRADHGQSRPRQVASPGRPARVEHVAQAQALRASEPGHEYEAHDVGRGHEPQPPRGRRPYRILASGNGEHRRQTKEQGEREGRPQREHPPDTPHGDAAVSHQRRECFGRVQQVTALEHLTPPAKRGDARVHDPRRTIPRWA